MSILLFIAPGGMSHRMVLDVLSKVTQLGVLAQNIQAENFLVQLLNKDDLIVRIPMTEKCRPMYSGHPTSAAQRQLGRMRVVAHRNKRGCRGK